MANNNKKRKKKNTRSPKPPQAAAAQQRSVTPKAATPKAATPKTPPKTPPRVNKHAARRAAQARKKKRDLFLVGAVVVLVVAGIIGLAIVTRSNDTGVTDSAAWDLPALTGDTDDDGVDDRYGLASYRGTPLVVNFFASWCTSCEAELPRFVQADNALGDQLEVVFVNSNETGNWRPMAERTGIIDRTLIKDIKGANGNGLYRSLGGTGGMPLTAFYDSNGNLAHVDRGELSTPQLASRLQQLFGLTV